MRKGIYLSLSLPFSLVLWSKSENEKLTQLLPCTFHNWWLLLCLYVFTLEYMLPVGQLLVYLVRYDILRHKVGLNEYLLHE